MAVMPSVETLDMFIFDWRKKLTTVQETITELMLGLEVLEQEKAFLNKRPLPSTSAALENKRRKRNGEETPLPSTSPSTDKPSNSCQKLPSNSRQSSRKTGQKIRRGKLAGDNSPPEQDSWEKCENIMEAEDPESNQTDCLAAATTAAGVDPCPDVSDAAIKLECVATPDAECAATSQAERAATPEEMNAATPPDDSAREESEEFSLVSEMLEVFMKEEDIKTEVPESLELPEFENTFTGIHPHPGDQVNEYRLVKENVNCLVEKRIQNVEDGVRCKECSQCTFVGRTSSQLKIHVRDSHPEQVEDGRQQVIQCEFCQYSSGRKDLLSRHYRSVHGGEKPALNGQHVPCNQCDHVAKDPPSLRRHVDTVHNNNRKKTREFACTACPHTAASIELMKKHRRMVHGINFEAQAAGAFSKHGSVLKIFK